MPSIRTVVYQVIAHSLQKGGVLHAQVIDAVGDMSKRVDSMIERMIIEEANKEEQFRKHRQNQIDKGVQAALRMFQSSVESEIRKHLAEYVKKEVNAILADKMTITIGVKND